VSLYLLIPACLAAGALVGFLSGMLGIGGGLIAIPLLGLALGMSQQMAQGTALVMVLPTVLMAVRKYNQSARIDLGVAAAGAAGAVAFTWLGAQLALGISPVLLRRCFAVFLACLGMYYAWQARRRGRARAAQPAREAAMGAAAGPSRTHAAVAPGTAVPRRPARPLGRVQAAMLGVMAGTMGGFFSVGGAILAVPVLTTVFRLPQTAAQALALTMIIPGSCIALAAYAWDGQTAWHVGLPLAAGSLMLVSSGVRLAYRQPERLLRAAFSAVLFATAALLLLQTAG